MPDNINCSKKFTPPKAEYFFKRPAVDSLIREAVEKPLTTVIAGAGYGKTQAVLSALDSMEYKWAWMQLSEIDNYVSRGWDRFTHLFKAHNYNLYESLLSLGYPESIAAFDRFLRLISEEFAQKERFILVLDDFYFINNKRILNFIELFISACIPNLSIILISRKKPDISLAGMLSKGLLSRITEEDLRFSKNETKAYFQELGLNFTKNVYSDIYKHVDGWIFAIYLVGLAALKGDIDNHNPVLIAKIDIFDLLEKEIFKSVSRELQDFFIKVSDLEGIPSGLIKELTKNNLTLMKEMTQTSLIRYDSGFDSYRMHHLFREFLFEKKGRLKKEDFIDVYLTAAKWFEKNGYKSEAINYYKKCGCYNEIFDIILSINKQIPKEVADSIIELIEEAPRESVNARPVMRVVKARYMFNNNKIDDAKRELLEIRREYEALPKTEENLAVLGETYIILALISILNQDYEFEELFKTADKYLPGGSKIINNKVNIAEGLNVCSINNSAAGELKKKQDALFNAAPYASRVLNGCGYGTENLNAAESGLYLADLKSAEKHAYEAIYKSRKYRQYDVEYMANFVLVRIFTAKGNYEKAFDIINQMETQLKTLQNSICISLYDVISGWFYMKIGYTDKVAKWIKHEEETKKMLAPVHLGREYLVRSDCLLAEERYYELLAFMKETDKMYESRGILFAVIQNKITKAIIYHYMGNHTKSIKALQEAFEQSNPNDLIMQFIEYGNKMRTLIHAARLNNDCKIPKEWLDKIYTKSSTYAKQLSQVVTAYNLDHAAVNTELINLSKRELEVLTYLSRGLTRDEIAKSCFLAVSSINGIIKSIYNKLGASNIAEAIRIAKDKEIL